MVRVKGKGVVEWVEDSAHLDGELKRLPKEKPTVLVVDDNKGTLKEIVKVLDDGERNIIAVGESGSAADILYDRGAEIDLLVTDFRLRRGNDAGMQGDELCEIAKKVNPQIKTIMVSGDPGDARKGAVDKIIQKGSSDGESNLDSRVVKSIVKRVENPKYFGES